MANYLDLSTDILATIHLWDRVTKQYQKSVEQSSTGVLPKDRKALDKIIEIRLRARTAGTRALTILHSDNYIK